MVRMRFNSFLRMPVRLEHAADLELEFLDLVRGDRIDRDPVAELERADRRIPCQAHARGKPEVLELRLEPVHIDLAGIEETRDAHRAFALQDRVEEFGVADDLALAAQR